MLSRLVSALIFIIPVSATLAEEKASLTEAKPWEQQDITIETGLLWQAGTGTPLAYRFVQTQASWRSREVFGWDLQHGSRLLVRHRLTLIGSWVQQGPESHYVAFAGSPSLEWWNAKGSFAAFGGAGGGFGLIDSRGVKGGQGQDFTLNWFARGGVEWVAHERMRWSLALMFQHLSNGGRTDPNPGIDAVGFMTGLTWKF